MFITPIAPIDSIGLIQSPQKLDKAQTTIPFRDVYEEAIKNVVETDEEVNKQATLLATGQTDNLEALGSAITKAQLSLSMMVQLRNRAVDAYSELMRINL